MAHIGDMDVIDVTKFGTVEMNLQKIATTKDVNLLIGTSQGFVRNVKQGRKFI